MQPWLLGVSSAMNRWRILSLFVTPAVEAGVGSLHCAAAAVAAYRWLAYVLHRNRIWWRLKLHGAAAADKRENEMTDIVFDMKYSV